MSEALSKQHLYTRDTCMFCCFLDFLDSLFFEVPPGPSIFDIWNSTVNASASIGTAEDLCALFTLGTLHHFRATSPTDVICEE